MSKQISSVLPMPGMWSSPMPASEKEPMKAATAKEPALSLPLLVGSSEKASTVNSRCGAPAVGLA